MNCVVNDKITEEIFCVKGQHVFMVNVAENSMCPLFSCGVTNANQILIVPDGFIIKNTAGKIVKFSRLGKELWSVTLGSDICTDDDCVYDNVTDKIVFFCYSHKTRNVWLCELDNRTGEYFKLLFFNSSMDSNIHTYTVLALENGIFHYVETINNIDTNEIISRVFQGEENIWETPGILSGATHIKDNKFYNYCSFFDLEMRQRISFDEKCFPLPVYKVMDFRDGYCLIISVDGKDKLIVTDNFFNKQEEIIISGSDYFCVNDNVYSIQGDRIKQIPIT